jgi:hypothetical protein
VGICQSRRELPVIRRWIQREAEALSARIPGETFKRLKITVLQTEKGRLWQGGPSLLLRFSVMD